MKTKRTGRSFNHTINNCPPKTLRNLGFTEAEISRMSSTRRVLPLVDDAKTPCIPARKLWERIGKPYGRFRAWADEYIKPVAENNAEIYAKLTKPSSGAGRPQTDYILSRDVAALMAMQARTHEGDNIRRYFLDMERLVVRLSEYTGIRAESLIRTDNRVTHLTRAEAGNKAKAGEIPRSMVQQVATEDEKRIKSLVCRVLTGMGAGDWEDMVGRRIRDTLDTEDLNEYSRAYDFASVLFAARKSFGEIEQILSTSFANCIHVEDYLTEQHLEVA